MIEKYAYQCFFVLILEKNEELFGLIVRLKLIDIDRFNH